MIRLEHTPPVMRGCRTCGSERVVPDTGYCKLHLNAIRETVQLPVFELGPIVRPQYSYPRKNSFGRFLEFHKANPHVYVALKNSVRKVVEAGVKHAGIRMFWENLRYSIAVSKNSDYEFNNNYARYYARLLQDETWVPAGFFTFRERRGK